MYDERRTRPWKRTSATFFGRDVTETSNADADACVETRLNKVDLFSELIYYFLANLHKLHPRNPSIIATHFKVF